MESINHQNAMEQDISRFARHAFVFLLIVYAFHSNYPVNGLLIAVGCALILTSTWLAAKTLFDDLISPNTMLLTEFRLLTVGMFIAKVILDLLCTFFRKPLV